MKSRPRLMWKTFYRSRRVALREIGKAYQDLLIFGTGATITGDVEIQYGPVTKRELIKHIPVTEISFHVDEPKAQVRGEGQWRGLCGVRAVRSRVSGRQNIAVLGPLLRGDEGPAR